MLLCIYGDVDVEEWLMQFLMRLCVVSLLGITGWMGRRQSQVR